MIEKYFDNIIISRKNRIIKSDKTKCIVDKCIENFNAYIYAVEKYKEYVDVSENTIFEFATYFSYIFEGIINDLVIYNIQPIVIIHRVLLELYFKFVFIISSDDFVRQLFSDFKAVDVYNLSMLENTIEKMTLNEQNRLKKDYEKVRRKYKLDSHNEYSSEAWIKIALEHLGVKKPTKQMSKLIEYLVEKNYIDITLESDYKSCCDFIHSSQNAFGLTQVINKNNNNYDLISNTIDDFNFIILSIIEKLSKKVDSKLDDYAAFIQQNIELLLNIT